MSARWFGWRAVTDTRTYYCRRSRCDDGGEVELRCEGQKAMLVPRLGSGRT